MTSRFAVVAAACTFTMILGAGSALAALGNNSGHGNHQPSPVTEVASQLNSPMKVAFGPNGSFLVVEAFPDNSAAFQPRI